MDFNSIQPRDALTVPRDNLPRQTEPPARTEASSPTPPSTAPDGDGVLATFESTGPGEERADYETFGREKLGRAVEQAAERDTRTALSGVSFPTNADIQIEVDPDTNETTFSLRDRDTGEIVREIPEQELTEALREGTRHLIDRTF